MLKIYGVPISVHTRKVIVVALAKELAHEVVPVVPVIPDNPPAELASAQPDGQDTRAHRRRLHDRRLGCDLRLP